MSRVICMKSEFGENLCSMEKGNLLYNVLKEELIVNKNDMVEIDFHGLKVVTSSFFNASISYLLKDYEMSHLQSKFKFINMREDTRFILNASLSNAMEFYKNRKV